MREFTRIAWASQKARAVWEPRIHAISTTWLDIELVSVANGLRPAALVFERPGLMDRIRQLELQAFSVAPTRFAVSVTPSAGLELRHAYNFQQDERIGELLGFPLCCRDFFNNVWNHDRHRDTTLSMNGTDGPIECNILGRWLGIRLVPHLPCSFTCQDTVSFAQRLLPLWPQQEFNWASEILSWPTLYSSLHGVAIITMPVVKVVTDTDYEPSERKIKRYGTSYPTEAPRGLGFPFTPPPTSFPLTFRKTA